MFSKLRRGLFHVAHHRAGNIDGKAKECARYEYRALMINRPDGLLLAGGRLMVANRNAIVDPMELRARIGKLFCRSWF